MDYRKLGKSDIRVTPIILGTWAIGGWGWGGTDDQQAVGAILAAIDRGMTSIDTAPIYGFGHAEEIIAQAIEGRREQVQILTKFGLRWDSNEGMIHFRTYDNYGNPVVMRRLATSNSIIKECEDSLRRLRTDHIDLYQCHWFDYETPIEEMANALDRLLSSGKILAAGVSNFSRDHLQAALNRIAVASEQPPYSMVNRKIEQTILPFCRENDIGVIVYSPLQQGLLTGKVTMDREFPETDVRSISDYFREDNRRQVLDLLDRIKPIADSHDATLAQLAINWTIQRSGIAGAIVGARNPQQAQENAQAADFELLDDEVEFIDQELDELELQIGPQPWERELESVS